MRGPTDLLPLPPPPPLVYDAADVARLLRCSQRHIWRMRDNSTLPKPVKIGRLVRWPRIQIDTWIANGCPKPAR
jgi:predicted DNA-binding transcriptional regulator AlpA